MNTATKSRIGAGAKRPPPRAPLDLTHATEAQIVAAFADESIVDNPPRMPASMAGAIDLNHKILTGAKGLIDAWSLGGDSRLAPLGTDGSHHPDLMRVLSTVRRMVATVANNHKTMARLFPARTPKA
jgi:hypothetical protein